MFIKYETQGRVSEEVDPARWNRRISLSAYYKPVDRLRDWRMATQEIEHLRVQYVKFCDSIHIGERLPPKFEFAMASLELLLINNLQFRTRDLSMLLPRLVVFPDFYKRDIFKSDLIKFMLDIKKTGQYKAMLYQDPLHWCLLQIATTPEDPKTYDASMLFAFLDG